MKILLATHAFPPASTAGVEVYTLRLARALAARSHDVLVMTAVHDLGAQPYSVRPRSYEGVSVVEVVNVHHRGTLRATYSDPDLDAVLSAVVDAFAPDAVHLQHLLNLSTGVISAGKRKGARVLLTLHDYWLSCPRDGLRMRESLDLCATMDHTVCAECLKTSPYLQPRLQRGLSTFLRRAGLGGQLHKLHKISPLTAEGLLGLLGRITPVRSQGLAAAMDDRARHLLDALRDVDLVLAPTRFVRDRALEFGLAPEKVRVVPYGAVLGSPQRREVKNRERLGYVGTIAPHKGVHVLVEAFRGIPHPSATLDIFGSLSVAPSYVEKLRDLALGDARVRFRGGFAEGGQDRVLAGLDLLVVPSLWWENSPLTILESLAAGVPVIATSTGGVPEIVPGPENGILVRPGDVQALRDAIVEVLEGRRFTEPCNPLTIKTVEEGAEELLRLYGA